VAINPSRLHGLAGVRAPETKAEDRLPPSRVNVPGNGTVTSLWKLRLNQLRKAPQSGADAVERQTQPLQLELQIRRGLTAHASR
jgi:hypothetical protein